MVEWLAGNRIRGTSTERTTTTGFNPVVGVEGGWKELDRTTLGSSANIIDVSSLADKRYYMVLYDLQRSGSNNMQFNSLVGNTTIDGTANYAQRKSIDGGADDTTGEVSLSKVSNTAVDTNLHNVFSVGYIANKSDKEKLFITHVVDSNIDTASNVPKRAEIVSKWSDISNPIDIIRADTAAGGRAFGADSEVVVLGWDPADTHSSNFWEELASVTTTGALSTVDSGVFTSKKYLWCQIMTVGRSGVATNSRLRVGNTTIDVNNNYSSRRSADGGTDTPVTGVSYAADIATNTGNQFTNLFIINNSANEKLIMGHSVDQNTATAGYVPRRTEFVGKHVTTGSQLDIIGMYSGGSDTFDAGAVIKVWGSD